MDFQALIQVNTHYTRSIHLERDARSRETVAAYIPTSRAMHTLGRIAATLGHADHPRAWALTGPYGSGKSLFAVFLSHLLGAAEHPATAAARNILSADDPALADAYRQVGGKGYCAVLLTGTPAPLGKHLLRALARAAESYWTVGRPPKIVETLRKAAQDKNHSVAGIVELVAALQKAVAATPGGQGVLIVVDELGKFLEYQARHPEINEIHLLQELAELAYQGHAAPLHVAVLLHQAFEQYARGLGEKLKHEWQKVQGRFESIAFLESTEQVLRVLRHAIRHELDPAAHPRIRQAAERAAATGVYEFDQPIAF